MQASQTHPSKGRSSTSSAHIPETTELARLRETCRRQSIVIDALTAMLRNLRDGAMALRAENAELRAIQAPQPRGRAQRGGGLRGTRDDADQARRATVQAVRSAISGPQRLPYTLHPAQDQERTAAAQPTRRSPRGG